MAHDNLLPVGDTVVHLSCTYGEDLEASSESVHMQVNEEESDKLRAIMSAIKRGLLRQFCTVTVRIYLFQAQP